MRHTAVGLLIGVALAFAGGRLIAAAPQGPTSARNDDVMAALLVEVKELRAAIEQMTANSGRIQLAVARLQMEEGRINTMIRRADDVRDSLASAQHDVSELTVQQERLEKAVDESQTALRPEERDTLTASLASAKRQLARRQADATRLTADEAQLASDIATAQARWAEFSRRLDELDRMLSNPRR